MKNYFVKVLAFLILFVFSAFTASAKYISVVDSGSTGSTIYLYKFDIKDGNLEFKVIPLKDNNHRTGIAHINFKDISSYIAPLITSLRNGLPKGVNESDVDFYFMSTGDMRAVSPYLQNLVFMALRLYLKQNTELKVKFAGTMYEKLEGVYDWISVNLLERKIGTAVTNGVIDIGGATIEVAYAVDEPDRPFTQKVVIGKYNYYVYSRSYLGIGNDHFREQYLDNPDCIPKGLSLVTTTGTGNYPECLKATKSLLVDVHHIDKIPQDIIDKTQFVGITYFYYLTSSKPFNLGNELTIREIKNKAMQFASNSWVEMQKKWPDNQYLSAYYLGSALVINLLETLGFGEDTKIKVLNNIDGSEISWALGAAAYFYCGNSLQLNKKRERHKIFRI